MALSQNAVYFCGWRESAVVPAGIIYDLCAAIQGLLVGEEAAGFWSCGSLGWLRWQGPLEMA